MDTDNRLIVRLKDEKGMVLVFVAIAAVMLFCFVSIAVDISYRHVAKAELQNAADSSAVAGAWQLPDQTSAQSAAIAFAAKHAVMGNPSTPVTVLPGDVTFGNYNRFTKAWVPNGTPVNAVEVWARRDKDAAEDPQSKLDLFFGEVVGHPQIAVSASAIAVRLTSATAYFLLRHDSCIAPTDPATGQLVDPIVLTPTSAGMAWTSLGEHQTAHGLNVSDLICQEGKPHYEICGNPLFTTGGNVNSAFRDMEATFYDPVYDAAAKTFNQLGVETWTVTVPVTEEDPTGQPHPVLPWGYAEVRMTRACAAGVGNPCGGERSFFAPQGVCPGGSDGTQIVIDRIRCFSCEESANMFGSDVVLVR